MTPRRPEPRRGTSGRGAPRPEVLRRRCATLWTTIAALFLLTGAPVFALDVTHYRLEIGLQAGDEAITGAATLSVVLDAGDADAIELDFVGLEITGLAVGGILETGWSREGGRLHVPMPAGSAAGDGLEVEIFYEGIPTPYVAPWGSWGLVRSQDRVFTVNVTEGARHWFPCDDRLVDKASVELLVSVPEAWQVAAPGALLAVEPDGAGRIRYHWSASWPLPTYLIHFAAGPYVRTDEEHGGITYQYYLHPTLYADAADTFAHAPAAMEMLVARYGPYPFPKVAFDEIDLGGAVENPSCVSIGTQILVPEQVYEDVIAHEMSHAWFQGVVTVATWDDVWLSEGMATYHEALYHEHVHGPGTLADYTDSLAISYRAVAEMAEGYFPVAQPESLWGVTTYRKGALVLHTLSHVTGREVFDQILLDYLDAYAWGSATTADFQAIAEDTAGLDLGAFFDEWVHGVGYPQFGLAWRPRVDGGRVDVAVEQRQPDDWPLYLSVPLELEFVGLGGESQREVLHLTGRRTTASFEVPFEPEGVTLDPDRWLLKTVEEIPFPEDVVGAEAPPESGPEPPPTDVLVGPEAPPADRGGGGGSCAAAEATRPGSWALLLLLAMMAPLVLRRPRVI